VSHTPTKQAPPPPPKVTHTASPGVSIVGTTPPPSGGTSTSSPDAFQYLDTPPGNTDIRFAHGSISRAEILIRAQRWVAEQVPYSQTAWWSDADGIYRQDCSGYVSMAWALDQNIDFWTGNLNTVSHVIDPGTLLPGDILLSTGHTVLFAGWANAAHTLFDYYEESHTGTNARFVVDAPLADFLIAGFTPFRYDGVVDAGRLPANPANGLVFAALQLGSNELAPNGNIVSAPPPASWQAGYVASNSATPSDATPSAVKQQAPAMKPVADVSSVEAPLPFVLASSGVVFLVGGAVIARGAPRVASSGRHKRRH
jgi:hypothetical protein